MKFSRKEQKIYNALKTGKRSIPDIGGMTHLKAGQVESVIKSLRKKNMDIRSERGLYYIPVIPEIKLHRFAINLGDEFGIISDTHMGSKYEALAELGDMYRVFDERGIESVLHAGDLEDGTGTVYRGHIYEMRSEAVGLERMLEYVADNYPDSDAKTYFIAGNHDESWRKSVGVNIGKLIEEKRDDLNYLGELQTRIRDRNSRMEVDIVHPGGGRAYARSYKIQKSMEELTPENRPDVLIRGHRHYAMFMPYLDSYGIEAGCFQHQTNYGIRQGGYPQVGGAILSLQDREKRRLRYEWFDYKKI